MAYREFEERAGRERPVRGSKADLIAYALEHVASPFGIADIERLCPNVSREMIRIVMKGPLESCYPHPMSSLPRL